MYEVIFLLKFNAGNILKDKKTSFKNLIILALVYLKCFCSQEEQAAKLKAEKIRVALEKIKEAQVKKVILGFFKSVLQRGISS